MSTASEEGSARYASMPALDEEQLRAYHALPPAISARRLDFDEATVLTLRTFPPQFVLRVSGTKPYANMNVALVPLVYVRQPEHWQIEVVGTLTGIGLPALAPYSVSLPLAGYIGTKGIEVVGATRTQVFDLVEDSEPPALEQPGGEQPTGEAPAGTCRDWTATIDRQAGSHPVLVVRGECEFPTSGFDVELVRHEPQGINPRDLLLDRVVRAPTGPAADVITTVPVRYAEVVEGAGFDTVTILPDGATIPVQDAY